MSHNVTWSKRRIRIMLTRLDKVDLRALCQDFFSEVDRKFGVGMRKDEEISLLIDHCERTLSFDELLSAVREHHSEEYFSCLPKSIHATELFMHYEFDMDKLIIDCEEAVLSREQGLIRLAIPHIHFRTFTPLTTRLEKIWDRQLHLHSYDIESGKGSINDAILHIDKFGSVSKDCGDVLFLGDVPGEYMAEFSKGLYCKFKDKEPENRLVVIMANRFACVELEGVIPLAPPNFSYAAVKKWINKISNALELPKDIMELWRKHMLNQCRIGGELRAGMIYSYIETKRQLYHGCESTAEFHQKLAQELKRG